MPELIAKEQARLAAGTYPSQLDVEPDVTWGRGGIDDWGWTAVEPVLDRGSLPSKVES